MSIIESEPSAESLDPSAVHGWPAVHRFTVEEYQRLGEAGILTKDDRVELLDGRILNMSPIGTTHFCIVSHITNLIAALLPAGWHVRTQGPITLSSSEPEPDLAIVRGELFDYLNRHPAAADIALLIEVADSSLPLDRGLKASIYAADAIPLYWIVDLVGRRVEVLRDPGPAIGNNAADYRSRQFLGLDAELTLTIGGQELRVPVKKLFGREETRQ